MLNEFLLKSFLLSDTTLHVADFCGRMFLVLFAYLLHMCQNNFSCFFFFHFFGYFFLFLWQTSGGHNTAAASTTFWYDCNLGPGLRFGTWSNLAVFADGLKLLQYFSQITGVVVVDITVLECHFSCRLDRCLRILRVRRKFLE